MDMSFANQALCAEFFVTHRQQLAAAVHEVPIEIDRRVAHLKLAAMNVAIDVLTPRAARLRQLMAERHVPITGADAAAARDSRRDHRSAAYISLDSTSGSVMGQEIAQVVAFLLESGTGFLVPM